MHIGSEIRTNIASFKMKRAVAPFFGCDISDCFSKIPVVPIEITGIVLTFAIRMLGRFSQNGCAVLPRTLAVAISILNSDLNNVRFLGGQIAFCDGEAPVSRFHLDAMVGDAQTYTEVEGLRQPVSSRGWVRVYENRNYWARRN